MDVQIDVSGEASLIETVHIDRLAGPFRWIKWTNVALLSIAVISLFTMVSSALRGRLDVSIIVTSLILIFPGWIAWKNVNVVNSVTQRYSIRAMLLVGFTCLALALFLALVPFISGSMGDEWAIGIGCYLVGGIIALTAALSIWRLRHRVIDPLGVKLTELLSTLSQQPVPCSLHNVRPQRPLLGWTLVATSVILFVGVDFVPATWWWLHVMWFKLGFIFLLVARSTLQPTAKEVLKADNRNPVLLLRSFIDDEGFNLMASLFDTTLESRLTSHFARYGPFVAVGAPSERLPVIGAARMKLTDAEWQDQVVRWIDNSVVILAMASVTDWVEWELKQVIAHNALNRLIICFPSVVIDSYSWEPDRFGMEARLDQLRRTFAETRWSEALRRLDDAKTLRSLVFGEDRRVTVVRARSRNRNAYHLAVLIAHWVSRADRPDAAIGAGSPPPRSRRLFKTVRWFVSVPLLLLGASAMVVGFDRSLRAGMIPMALGLLLAGLVFIPTLPRRVRHFVSQGWRLWVSCGLAAALFGYGALVFCAIVMYSLGLDYANGHGMAQDYAEARKWYQKAADAGNVDAMNNLGVLYDQGQGVAQHYGKARKWFQKAADAGNADAMDNLGSLYRDGLGVAQDYSQARLWYRKAVDGGNTDAMDNLGSLYHDGLGVAQDYGKARQWFQKAADAGNAYAMFDLGLLLENGQGVARDYGQAREWYQKAAAAGNPDAKKALSRLH